MKLGLHFRSFGSGLILTASLLCAGPARAGDLAPDLWEQYRANPDSTQSSRVIVRFSSPTVISLSVALAYGGQVLDDLPLIGSSVLSVPVRNLDELAADSAVAWVSPDRPLSRQWDYDVETAGADRVWSDTGSRGGGIGVAVLDTGIAPNAAEWSRGAGTGSRVVKWLDLVDGRASPYDDNGHGTHVAGIVLGGGSLSGGAIRGIAPEADLVAVKVLGRDGSGRVSTVIRGIEWCIRSAALYNIRVINLSMGHVPRESADSDPLCRAVRRAVCAGLAVVCSAGNLGRNGSGETVYGGITCPGNEPSAITVGALNTRETAGRADDGVCSYSSRGPTYGDGHAKPDLVAPGNWIVSIRSPGSRLDDLYPGNRVDWDSGSPATVDYFRLSGTSMAAPQVAGAIALMLQGNPGLDPNSVKAVLMYTAEPVAVRDASGSALAPGLSLLTQGAGSLNALGAVVMGLRIDAGAPVGGCWLASTVPGESTLLGRTFYWRSSVAWGAQVYSGPDVFRMRQRAWTGDLLWGNQSTWGGDVSWNDNGVAAEQFTWSQRTAWNDQTLWGNQSTWGDDATPTEGEPPGP